MLGTWNMLCKVWKLFHLRQIYISFGNIVSDKVANIGALKQNLGGTAGKLMPIQSTVILQWVFFSCFGLFTKCLYAQPVQQKFAPGRSNGYVLLLLSHPSAQGPWAGHEAGKYFLFILYLVLFGVWSERWLFACRWPACREKHEQIVTSDFSANAV